MLQDGGNVFFRSERTRVRGIYLRQNRRQSHRGIIEGKHRQQRKIDLACANVKGSYQSFRLCVQFAVRVHGTLGVPRGTRREQNRRRILGTGFGLERAGKVAFRKFLFQAIGQKKTLFEACERFQQAIKQTCARNA